MSRAQRNAVTRLAGLRVLVVDDDEDSRLLLAATLRREGADVEMVDSALGALSSLDEVLPDLVISDIGMPEIDGYELMRRIRRRERDAGGELPAVAITAFTETESREQALAAGFQAFVPKPLDREVLIATLAALTGR